MSARVKRLSQDSTESNCDNCKANNRPGRGLLLGRVRLNAATDDFVISGCFILLLRIIQLLSLLFAFFIFHFRQGGVKVSSLQDHLNTTDSIKKNESTTSCTSNSPISASMVAYILVCVKYCHTTRYIKHKGLLLS